MADVTALEPHELIPQISHYYKKRQDLKDKGALDSVPSREYNLIYDSTSESLEPVYFWILDFMNSSYDGVDKLVDNFVSSPGSGHFSELMGKATQMQNEAMKIYGMVNTVIKSILNLIYDLKEFNLRLQNYDDSKSKDKDTRESGLLSLKQIWMDQVDIKKGRGAINMLAQDLNFVTLRDAFMIVEDERLLGPDGKELDLNDRVKRILKARVKEFLDWQVRSEKELRKRYEIEKTYLKTQVNTVKLYSKWAKPYLRAAEELAMPESRDAALVKAFNTITLGLTILGKKSIDVQDAAVNKNLPEDFRKIKFRRTYYACVVVDFKFRGIPQKAGQHYAFGGRAEVTFRAYVLNEEELDLFQKKLEESEFGSAMGLVEGMTSESLDQLQEDIDEFLEGEAPLSETAAPVDVNPFMALLGLGEKKPEAAKKKKEKEISELKDLTKDNYAESVVRTFAEVESLDACYRIYDVYKKAHKMASTPGSV